MITTTCFSVCGYFYYPVIKNDIFLNFIKKVSDAEKIDFNIEFISVDKNKVNHKLLFESGDFLVADSTKLNSLESDECTPLSVSFRSKYNVSSEILIKPVDSSGFEIDYRLEKDELDVCTDKSLIIQEIAQIFFEVFRPLYGCCGTEMFPDGVEFIEENDIINSKFYYIGYVDFHMMNKFEFLNDKLKKFHVKSLQSGNMYLNKIFSNK